ncbi:MAG TPA: saccharopine dehydrogenase C-terminal domain-containing protein [Chitinophagaceae bacterium]|nr:saccharopine dehydrogenase C-terminal domain-containing protein [Chitinophagaceae bacterium]
MKTISLFGAGRSSTILIDYLLEHAIPGNWRLVVIDADPRLAQSKIGNAARASALSFDIHDSSQRTGAIRNSDLVISLLPAQLHQLVAMDCLRFEKHLLTASYVDDQMREMAGDVKSSGLLFLCEMGLDPGIDHMSAMDVIDRIRAAGGEITSFVSHCGGLVAPESDDNPWHYKISWNSRNIVLAGKAGARYREDGEDRTLPYEQLFSTDKLVEVPGVGFLGWYPNRDSLGYLSLYGLPDVKTFIRTTLRHPDFMYGWKNIIDLRLTDDTARYDTDGKTLQQVFKEHMDRNGFGEWVNRKLTERFEETRGLMENLMKLLEAEEEAREEGEELPEAFMAADEKGNLNEIEIDEVKNRAAAVVAHKMHEANLTLKQLFFLGMDDNDTFVNHGLCSPADILQFALERKLSLRPYDKDMVVMYHEISYEQGGRQKQLSSSLVVKGEDGMRTAMARTVGLPLGIAAKLILEGQIRSRGVVIPTAKEIYQPVLEELASLGIRFEERSG